MKKWIFFIVTLVLFADQPPSWQTFEVTSSNKAFKAKVDVAKKIGNAPSSWRYKLIIYNAHGKKQWSSHYQYDGYPYGNLSNDGQTFVYVNDAYFEDKAIVLIYHKGRYKQEIKGSAFKIAKNKILSSTSSFIWLSDQRYELDNDKLTIHTIDGQKFKVALKP